MKKALLLFYALFLYFTRASSQVISEQRAAEGTLKHLVRLKVYMKYPIREEKRYELKVTRGAGALVKLNWVLTCAHIVAPWNETRRDGGTREHTFHWVEVLAGTKDYNDKSEKAQRIGAGENSVFVHENFSPTRKIYDVALIRLEKPFDETNSVKPAKLLEKRMKFDADAKCVVQGWGYNKVIGSGDKMKFGKDEQNEARQGRVHLLKGEKCGHYVYNNASIFDSNLQFCYGCDTGQCEQAAGGDSGAPVVCALDEGEDPLRDGVVFAVHSYGCAEARKKCLASGPSAGTDVRAVKQWIDGKIEEKQLAGLVPYVIFAAMAGWYL